MRIPNANLDNDNERKARLPLPSSSAKWEMSQRDDGWILHRGGKWD